MARVSSSKKLLGDKPQKIKGFSTLHDHFRKLKSTLSCAIPIYRKLSIINELLFKLIKKKPFNSFLLPAVNEYINLVNENKLLPTTYQFSHFEYWLIHHSGLNTEEEASVRGKIVGRNVPREEYQCYFPVGMGKKQSGSHYVIAHLSPDVDTTIASFWGWVDAFSAMVTSGQHFWCIPGGPPDSPSMVIFEEYLGKNTIRNFGKFSKSIRVLSTDILTKETMILKPEKTLVDSMEHGYHDKAVVLVSDEGYYVGDFRSRDVEKARQVIIIIRTCLNRFQNLFQSEFISLFAKKKLHIREFDDFFRRVFESPIKELNFIPEFSPLQKKYLEQFFVIVLNLDQGLSASIADLAKVLSLADVCLLNDFKNQFQGISFNHLFDKSGHISEDRPQIFKFLNGIFNSLHDAIMEIRAYIERLDIIMMIKTKILKIDHIYLNYKDDVDNIKQKFGNQPFLTVVYPEANGNLLPMGIIRAEDIRKPYLGTVTLRDFSNFDEVQMPSYLNVISVIDHHKAAFQTPSTPNAIIGDTQSCNILIAEQAIMLNEQFSSAGMSHTSINRQIEALNNEAPSPKNARLLQRLYKRRSAVLNTESHRHFIDPKREFMEYLFYLHAIIDDTDLLTKVSYRDVVCISKLLNLMKSIQMKKEVEMISLDDIPRDSNFSKKVAQKILQNKDMYSIYNTVYTLREKGIENLLRVTSVPNLQKLFSDTKEQNGCCRVGQMKLFKKNVSRFLKVAPTLRHYWYENSVHINESAPKIDLFIQMTSTITSAEEVFKGKAGCYDHKDELWFWASPNMPGLDHLNYFLLRFKNAPELAGTTLELSLLGPNYVDLKSIFEDNFTNIKINIAKNSDEGLPIAVLRFNAGLLNSRKSMVSPYLPQLIT